MGQVITGSAGGGGISFKQNGADLGNKTAVDVHGTNLIESSNGTLKLYMNYQGFYDSLTHTFLYKYIWVNGYWHVLGIRTEGADTTYRVYKTTNFVDFEVVYDIPKGDGLYTPQNWFITETDLVLVGIGQNATTFEVHATTYKKSGETVVCQNTSFGTFAAPNVFYLPNTSNYEPDAQINNYAYVNGDLYHITYVKNTAHHTHARLALYKFAADGTWSNEYIVDTSLAYDYSNPRIHLNEDGSLRCFGTANSLAKVVKKIDNVWTTFTSGASLTSVIGGYVKGKYFYSMVGGSSKYFQDSDNTFNLAGDAQIGYIVANHSSAGAACSVVVGNTVYTTTQTLFKVGTQNIYLHYVALAVNRYNFDTNEVLINKILPELLVPGGSSFPTMRGDYVNPSGVRIVKLLSTGTQVFILLFLTDGTPVLINVT